jgi:hypothetical protein
MIYCNNSCLIANDTPPSTSVKKNIDTSYIIVMLKKRHDSLVRALDSLSNISSKPITVRTSDINKDTALKVVLDSLRKCLNKGFIPDFFYDKCLDYRNPDYYVVNSEKKISLRFNMIKALSQSEIEKIISLANPSRLKETCPPHNADDSLSFEYGMPYREYSTWELLRLKLEHDKKAQ